MKKVLILLIAVVVANAAEAQFIKKRAINARIGYGMSSPYESASDIADDGLFLQGEYVLSAASWFEIRPYAGLIFTSSNGEDLNGNPTDEMAETNALLLGSKLRVRAPIPWIAPYLEIGIGASIGKFKTYTWYTDIRKSGVICHIPFSLGLELGRKNDVELAFSYYFQPTVEQFAGAFALGIIIPLKNRVAGKDL